jgi:hypothetical protein
MQQRSARLESSRGGLRARRKAWVLLMPAVFTFAIYWRKPGSLPSQDQKIIEQTMDLAAVAIGRKRTAEALRP